jgi:hypothetical protein
VSGGVLGVGYHEVWIADRGGTRMVGRVTGVTSLSYDRVRDDISRALVRVESPDTACCDLLAETRTVRHEVVIFRNGERVWEGPITRLEYTDDMVEIEAQDVLWFASRAALEQTLDYRSPRVTSVVTVIGVILRDAFGPPDSSGFNVYPFLTPIVGPGDPRTAAEYLAYSTTVWALLDKFAVSSGIDYTVVGRRILWWDTHLRAHVLPPLNDTHFQESIVVSEYGSELATRSYVTNNTGYASVATADQQWTAYYGLIDNVVTNYEEAKGTDAPTPAEAEAMLEQARRDIDGRTPAPVRLRLPGAVSLAPDFPVPFAQLIPGAWSRLTATRTCRNVSQWQKLNKVSVLDDAGGERVSIEMTSAPVAAVDLP